MIRKRLPEEVHEQVFLFVLGIAQLKKLLKGKVAGFDGTLLEANAAMKSIVRRDTGDDWKNWLKKLAQEAGIEDPSDDDLKQFDRGRKEAEHAIDLESGQMRTPSPSRGSARSSVSAWISSPASASGCRSHPLPTHPWRSAATLSPGGSLNGRKQPTGLSRHEYMV